MKVLYQHKYAAFHKKKIGVVNSENLLQKFVLPESVMYATIRTILSIHTVSHC